MIESKRKERIEKGEILSEKENKNTGEKMKVTEKMKLSSSHHRYDYRWYYHRWYISIVSIADIALVTCRFTIACKILIIAILIIDLIVGIIIIGIVIVDTPIIIIILTLIIILIILTIPTRLTLLRVGIIVMNERNSLASMIRMESRLTGVRFISTGVIGLMMTIIFRIP
jgi:hypothetical protein